MHHSLQLLRCIRPLLFSSSCGFSVVVALRVTSIVLLFLRLLRSCCDAYALCCSPPPVASSQLLQRIRPLLFSSSCGFFVIFRNTFTLLCILGWESPDWLIECSFYIACTHTHTHMHTSTRTSFCAAACASAMGFANFTASQATLTHTC